MEECLITNIVCSNSNKKCKICKLDKCKEVLNMIDVQQSIEDKYKILEIKKKLPKECKNCTFLEYIDLSNRKVRCFYRMKDKCMLK